MTKQFRRWFTFPHFIPLLILLVIGMVVAVHVHAAMPPTTSVTAQDIGDVALSHSGPLALSSDELAMLTQKNTLATEYAQVRAGQESPLTFEQHWRGFALQADGAHANLAISATNGLCIHVKVCPPANHVNVPQESQVNRFYCGPAAVEEALLGLGATHGPLGENLRTAPFPATGQHILADAHYLQTDLNIGTNWGTGLVEHTLNVWNHGHYYVGVNGSNMGGNFSLFTYESDLIFDVDTGHPLIGGVRLDPTPSRPHLIGYPTNQTHYHWITLIGYAGYATSTIYADSVHGDSQFWSWAVNVPAYGTVSTTRVMVPLLNTFGYIW